MRTVQLVVPGLVWPAGGLPEALRPLALPGLAALLASARITYAPSRAFESWLASQFNLPHAPLGAIRLAGESGQPLPARDQIILCADPVSLRFAREHLLLDTPASLAPTADELDPLAADLNRDFADIGRFHFIGERGYLELVPAHAARLDVSLPNLSDVAGRPIAHFQPQGAHATWWRRLANELQVFCHNHPLNAAREARGALPLNALWLWGAGSLGGAAQICPPGARLAGSGILLAGLARLAGCALDPAQGDWQLVDTLDAPAQSRDLAAWTDALATLDQTHFVPLAAALAAGQLDAAQIHAPSDKTLAHWQISRRPRWKFWARTASPAACLAALTSPEVSSEGGPA